MKRIKPTTQWEELRSSRKTVAALKKLAHAAHTSKHVLGLFAGANAADKASAAEAIAHELKLDLLHLDLSAVISKYIGETEKNLASVFGAVEQADAVLLFDEADALFGKRTEVKDSHDRYANIEVNYLLQRMEAYQGITILAISKADLNTAFLRRFQYVIDFS